MIVVGSPLSHASFAKFAVASLSFFLLSTFKSNQIVVVPLPRQDTQVTSARMSTWHFARQTALVVQASLLLSFSLGNLPSILQHHESWPSRRKPPGQNQTEFSQSCDRSVYCLQQWGLTHKFLGQLSTMAIVCTFQIWDPLTNNSKGKRPYPG